MKLSDISLLCDVADSVDAEIIWISAIQIQRSCRRVFQKQGGMGNVHVARGRVVVPCLNQLDLDSLKRMKAVPAPPHLGQGP